MTWLRRLWFGLIIGAVMGCGGLHLPATESGCRASSGWQEPAPAGSENPDELCEQAEKAARKGTQETRRQALELFEKARTFYQKAGNQSGVAQALAGSGTVYQDLGESTKAKDFFTQALHLQQTLGNRKAEATTLLHVGNALKNLGERQPALEQYTKALELCRTHGDAELEGSILQAFAIVYSDLGERDKALSFSEAALKAAQKSGNHLLEARIYNSLGLELDRRGQYQKAIESFERALGFAEKLDNPDFLGSVLNNLGFVNSHINNSKAALAFYERAFKVRENTGDRRGMANLLNNIGTEYAIQGDNLKAAEHLEIALKTVREIGDKSLEGRILNNLGILYRRAKQNDRALTVQEQALTLARATNDKRWEGAILLSIGIIYADAKDYLRAGEALSRSVTILGTIGEKKDEAKSLFQLAFLEFDEKKFLQALPHVEQAVSILETLRSNVGLTNRASFFSEVQTYYQLYLEILMELHRQNPNAGFDRLAFEKSEQARARTLLEFLVEARADIRQGVPPVLLERERTLQKQIAEQQSAITKVLLRTHTPAEETQVTQRYDELLESYKTLQNQIRTVSPQYAALTQPQPLRLAEIQQSILDSDTVLVEYALGKRHSYLWVVTQTDCTSYELPPEKEIEKIARPLLDSIQARGQSRPQETFGQYQARVMKADAEFSAQALQLSQLIFAPAATRLTAKRWLVVADNALQYVPFAALPHPLSFEEPQTQNPKTKTQNFSSPLIASHEIVMLPSASTLAVARREKSQRKPAEKLIAILADPVFENQHDIRLKSLRQVTASLPSTTPGTDNQSQERFSTLLNRNLTPIGTVQPDGSPEDSAKSRIYRLPGTRREANQIRKLAGDEPATEWLDFDASRVHALDPGLSQYRYLHFATHGVLDTERPELSALVLSMLDKNGQPVDGFLRTNDIYNLNLPAELVVLSACQTGLGKKMSGEGVVGLSRGFMYAGATRVMASLWKVSDRATVELMEAFYHAVFKEKKSPAAALQLAQLSLMKKKAYQSPYYWAAFVLQGEYR